ncbi:MAG: type IX secretion system protein PorQ [Chitinophagaceae bacterium]
MKLLINIFLLLHCCMLQAQTIGGNATYHFLKLPGAPLLSASGGVNISYQAKDAALAANNPALLNEDYHSQLALNFNNFFSGIKAYQLAGAYYHQKINTIFGSSIFFIDYGNIPQTDAAGNINGSFRPTDYVMQLSAAKRYLQKWSYGATVKFIQSNYQQYNSSAMAMDVAVLYTDSANNITGSVAAKNMGFQIKTYSASEDLPFDLQIGVTKKLNKAPFAFSFTAQQMHRFNISYNDTSFNNENNLASGSPFFNKLMLHFVFATHVFIGSNLEVTAGYNYLRRAELNLGSSGNGLNGFSAGLRAKFKKLQFQYARAYFQRNTAYNQFGLSILLNQFIGLGEP